LSGVDTGDPPGKKFLEGFLGAPGEMRGGWFGVHHNLSTRARMGRIVEPAEFLEYGGKKKGVSSPW
jgi:hypothetical protein